MNLSSKRAEYVALTGALLSLVFFAASLVVAGLSGSYAPSFLGWQILGGSIIWFVLVVVFHQRSLAEREKRDMTLAEQDRASDTIFQSSSNRQAVFTTAQRQLEVMEKYFMPVFSMIIAAYHIVIGWLCYAKFTSPMKLGDDLKNALLYSIFIALIAFISFLFSRYATGLSTDEKFKPLRAGGSILLASSLLSLLVWISLAFGHFKFMIGLTILGYGIPILMIVLGIETLLNLVMDVYRPRVKGQYARAAFDSRLLGTINEPGGILHSFSRALDYQFGFKVSQTWFVQLLGKAIIPLVMVGILAMYSLSCLVIVAPGEQAVIEHFGSFDRIANPGLNCKLPWPFEKAYKHPTTLVQQINIGFVEKEDEEEDDGKVKAFVWGEKHYDEEYELLVAVKTDTIYKEGEGGTVPVSLVIAAIPVQYIVSDLRAFLYNNTDSRELLEAICYRQIIQYAAKSTIETGVGSDSILGSGRKQAAIDLRTGIQKEANEFGLGVEIIFLGLQGVHPPVEVAKEYQDVTGAVQEKQAVIMEAEAERNIILSMLAGSVEESNRLYDMIAVRNKTAGDELNEALKHASGDIAKILSDASGYAFEKAALAKAAGERFQSQVKAFEASPTIYTQLLRLEMLEESLSGIRKYVILTEEDDTEIYIFDLQEKAAPSLYDMELDMFQE